MHYEYTDSYIYGGRQHGAKISGFEFYYVCKKTYYNIIYYSKGYLKENIVIKDIKLVVHSTNELEHLIGMLFLTT
jgi:hypothetical protein